MDDPTVEQIEYRFLLDSAPLTGWSSSPPYKTAAVLAAAAGREGNVTAEVRALNRKQTVSDVLSAEVVLHDRKPALTGKGHCKVNGQPFFFFLFFFFSVSTLITFSLLVPVDESHTQKNQFGFRALISMSDL